MTDLTFYTNPQSRGRIARWMLEETGADYETIVLGYADTMKGADYLAINPMGKVPAIRHGDTVVTEGAAICAYLADAFPEAGLAPPTGEQARGPYYRWLFFAAGPVEAAVTNKSLGSSRPRAAKVRRLWQLRGAIDTLENARLGRGPISAGDRFSAADVYVGSQIGFGMHVRLDREKADLRGLFRPPEGRPAAVRAARD